jgi:hypothetical protein
LILNGYHWPVNNEREMKKIITLLIFWPVIICHAQIVDTPGRLAAAYFREAEIAGKNQKLWHIKLYGPMLFVDEQTRIAYSNMPDSAGILKADDEIYKGILPKDVMVANTAINWQGKLWSVILWPLPQDHDERLNLVMHESFHRVQGQLGLPAHSPTADHLSTMYGRIYFLLELQALKAALRKPVNHRNADLANALLFREKRRELFPQSFNNERLLEMNEGLAEYTGVMLGRANGSTRQHLYNIIEHAADHKSLIRSFPYITGPVYGYLLYEKKPEWTLSVDSNSSFPGIIATNYHINLLKNRLNKLTAERIDHYNGKAIISTEKLKEEEHQKTVIDYVDRFTKQPVLTIKLIKMNIGFNPNNLFDLGEYGTVYPTAQIKDVWGQLIVSENGVLMKDWSVITLPAGEGISIKAQAIEGKGWKLTLNTGWVMVKNDSLHFGLVNKN